VRGGAHAARSTRATGTNLSTMKAKLIFDLTDPDDIRQHKIAVMSQEILWTIDDLNEWLREQVKYVEHTEAEYLMLEKTKDML